MLVSMPTQATLILKDEAKSKKRNREVTEMDRISDSTKRGQSVKRSKTASLAKPVSEHAPPVAALGPGAIQSLVLEALRQGQQKLQAEQQQKALYHQLLTKQLQQLKQQHPELNPETAKTPQAQQALKTIQQLQQQLSTLTDMINPNALQKTEQSDQENKTAGKTETIEAVPNDKSDAEEEAEEMAKDAVVASECPLADVEDAASEAPMINADTAGEVLALDADHPFNMEVEGNDGGEASTNETEKMEGDNKEEKEKDEELATKDQQTIDLDDQTLPEVSQDQSQQEPELDIGIVHLHYHSENVPALPPPAFSLKPLDPTPVARLRGISCFLTA